MDNTSATIAGTLYVVATPIGNLQDISARAITILKSVDAILAEDTRHSQQLLNALGINKQLTSLHAHNEIDKSQLIIEKLQNGQSFALISDAGTPLISDPGFILIRTARLMGITIVPIPGACAFIAALSVAGIPCDSFLFAGFLPAKQPARIKKLQLLRQNEHTVILYESTHRLLDCIDDIIDVFGSDYCFFLAKEITKSFEHFLHTNALEIKSWLLAESARIKGEFVIILPAQAEPEQQSNDEQLLRVLLTELPVKQAVKLASSLSSTSKNDLYKLALQLQTPDQT